MPVVYYQLKVDFWGEMGRDKEECTQKKTQMNPDFTKKPQIKIPGREKQILQGEVQWSVALLSVSVRPHRYCDVSISSIWQHGQTVDWILELPHNFSL